MTLLNMMLGEVAPGGTGSGLYGMLDPGGHHGVRRRVDGRANTGVPRQEARRPGDEVRLAVPPDHAGARAGRARRSRWRCPVNAPAMLNTGAARVLRGAVRVHLGRRTTTASAFAGISVNTDLVQHRARHRHAARPVPADRLRARPGRFARPAAAGPGLRGHAADAPAAVRRHAHRRRRSSSSPSPTSRRSRWVRSRKVCTDDHHASTLRPRRRRRSRPARAGCRAACSTRSMLWTSPPGRVRASSTRARCGRTRSCSSSRSARSFTTVLAIANPSRLRLADRRSGSGSPCCSPTWPRPSPRAAARRRPTRCAGPRPTRSPAGWSTATTSTGAEEPVPAPQLRQGDRVVCEAGRRHPRRRRRHRGHRQRRRVGDHRRVARR